MIARAIITEGAQCTAVRLEVLLAVIAFGSCFLAPRSARADASEFRPSTRVASTRVALRLPFEVGLGDAWRRIEDGPVATSELSFLPGFSVERWELNGVVRGLYQNPHADLALGLRASVSVYDLLDGLVPIRVGLDGSYLTMHSGFKAAAGVQFGLGTLLGVGVWGGRDWDTERTYFTLALQLDPTKLADPIGAILELTPPEDRPHEL